MRLRTKRRSKHCQRVSSIRPNGFSPQGRYPSLRERLYSFGIGCARQSHLRSCINFPSSSWSYFCYRSGNRIPLGMPDIRQDSLDGETIPLDHPGYLAQLNELMSAGWKIIQTECLHFVFRPSKTAKRQSRLSRLRSIPETRERIAALSSRADSRSYGHRTRSTRKKSMPCSSTRV